MSFETSQEDHMMGDSMINSILLPSSIHLENLEQLIKNLEQHTFNIEHIFNKDNRQDLVDKSYSSNTTSTDNQIDENFLTRNLLLKTNPISTDHIDESISIDSLSTLRDNEKLLKINNQSLSHDQDSGFTWDDQYDTQANYSIAFNIDKSQETESKLEKFSNIGVNNINDWSMKSDFNTFEQHGNFSEKTSCLSTIQNPTNVSNSSTSWRQMKKNQRTTVTSEKNIQQSPTFSPINLYKIFQKKSNATTSSRSAFQLYRPPNDLTDSIFLNKVTIENHLNIDRKLTSPNYSSKHRYSPTVPIGSKSKSYDNLNEPYSKLSFSFNKSLPDLSFITQYSKELPRSHTTSPTSRNSTLSINVARTTSSPTLIQHQKYESDRPRTLKSIKRYKNSKHSTEPLGVFFSPQSRNNLTNVPNSINMKTKQPSLQIKQQTTNNLKSCLKYQSRANSCDIQATLKDQKPRLPSLSIPTLISNQDSHYSLLKYHHSKPETIQSSENINNVNERGNRIREHHSQYDLPLLLEQINQTKKSVSCSENISDDIHSPCNQTNSREQSTKRPIMRHDERRRCQTDIIHIDPLFHRYAFNDSPPNEFCLQYDDEDDDALMEEVSVDINFNVNKPIEENITVSSNSLLMNSIKIDLLETITDIIKQIVEIKQNEKSFFLNNENNSQLDLLLKNDFCTAIQNILEHGRKEFKKITLWKIIEISMSPINPLSDSPRHVPDAYYEAKTMAQNISSNWLYRFQAFIFFLLNKNELINWLYYFTRQKDVIQHYYQSPDALILVSIPTTFNLFERIMTQLEKLTPLPFQLTYNLPSTPLSNDNQLTTSMISMLSTKTNARNWLLSISRRAPKTFTQSIIQNNSTDTFRSTFTKKLNTLFTRTTSQQQQQQQQQQQKLSSLVTTKLPAQSQEITDVDKSSIITNNKPIVTPHEKSNDSIVQNIRSSIKSTGIISTFQSKTSRPSLNIDTPKSSRYHTTVLFPK